MKLSTITQHGRRARLPQNNRGICEEVHVAVTARRHQCSL